jgi:hypothetical protein
MNYSKVEALIAVGESIDLGKHDVVDDTGAVFERMEVC